MDIRLDDLLGEAKVRGHGKGSEWYLRPSVDDITAHLPERPSKPRAVMKMLMRTVKKTKTVAQLFMVFNLRCFLLSFRSYFTAETTAPGRTSKDDWQIIDWF